MKKLSVLLVLSVLALTSCGGTSANGSTSSDSPTPSGVFKDDWNYDSTNDVYYQLQAADCTKPVAKTYESMSIYVPGAYFTGTKNSNGLYTCVPKADGAVGSYKGSTAPIVFPVNTPGYAGQAAPAGYSYNTISSFLKAGLIYVTAGMRGKDINAGYAPWGVTDLKAAVRAYRYNASSLPGDANKIFTFGMSGGGAQSSLMGATGDSPLYTPYLEAIGAYMKDESGNTISDAIAGAMCWCPITSLDRADEAYEWNMGQFYTTNTRASGTFTSSLSGDLADDYATFINGLGLKNGSETLTLSASSSGHYLAGNYYDYIVSVAEESLNNYLSDTYTSTSDKASYVSSLGTWASYDSATNKATITDFPAFIKSQKNAQKPVGAFDGLSRGQGENSVFRTTDSRTGANHFDSAESAVLAANNTKYSSLSGYTDYRQAFTDDLALKDPVGIDMQTRVNMYNPMYFLNSTYAGYGTATIAPHWRIRTGIRQSDTALNTEVNLMLALKSKSEVTDVDFATVWNKQHVQAERTGSANDNFIAWVADCVK
jgi:hypothetical protein